MAQNRRWTRTWTNLIRQASGAAMRTVNVHEAKTHFSRLIDAAHAGETIVVAKDGRPWARLVPLEPAAPRRQPGVLAGRITLPPPEVLLEPLPAEELDALELPLP
jgi:prevent-host-death family protein